MLTDLKERQQMCVDLEYLMTQDMSIREEIIDEYVYLLDDKPVNCETWEDASNDNY